MNDATRDGITTMVGERRIAYVPLSELRGADRNPKTHKCEDIVTSYQRFGAVEPMVRDDRTGRLVAGHGRLEALIAIRKAGKEAPPSGVQVVDGQWLVPVLVGWASRDDGEAEAYLLASNQLTMAAPWAEEELSAMLASMMDEGVALDGVGFDEKQLRALVADAWLPDALPSGEIEGASVVEMSGRVTLAGREEDVIEARRAIDNVAAQHGAVTMWSRKR